MSKIGNKIAASVKQSIPSIFVEKSSVDESGTLAKVLFRVGTTNANAQLLVADEEGLTNAFEQKLGGTARLAPNSVHASGTAGLYFAYLKVNTPTIGYAEASTSKKFNMVSANLFADEDDNIWSVENRDGEKILMRTANDDLQEILKTRMAAPTMSVAAASIGVTGSFTAGMIVAAYDATAEKVRRGLALDNATMYDFDANKVVPVSSVSVMCASEEIKSVVAELNRLYGDRNATFAEVATTGNKKKMVMDFLTRLYSQNQAFLDQYIQAVDRFLAA
jgi:hypothetical protein